METNSILILFIVYIPQSLLYQYIVSLVLWTWHWSFNIRGFMLRLYWMSSSVTDQNRQSQRLICSFMNIDNQNIIIPAWDTEMFGLATMQYACVVYCLLSQPRLKPCKKDKKWWGRHNFTFYKLRPPNECLQWAVIAKQTKLVSMFLMTHRTINLTQFFASSSFWLFYV